MLAWLVTTAVRPRPRSSRGFSSRPTRNMNTSSPTWLMELRNPSESGGKRRADAAGAIHPRNDGPSRIPATISPTTCGCPIRRKRSPTPRAAITTAAICTSSSPSRGAGGGGRARLRHGGGRLQAASQVEDGGQRGEREPDQQEVAGEGLEARTQ